DHPGILLHRAELPVDKAPRALEGSSDILVDLVARLLGEEPPDFLEEFLVVVRLFPESRLLRHGWLPAISVSHRRRRRRRTLIQREQYQSIPWWARSCPGERPVPCRHTSPPYCCHLPVPFRRQPAAAPRGARVPGVERKGLVRNWIVCNELYDTVFMISPCVMM